MSFKNLIFFMLAFSKISAQSVGGVTSGAAAVCDTTNSGFISLNNYTGNILYWEMSLNGVNWTQIGNPTSTQSYFHLKQNTSYRAIVKDGAFPEDTSTVSTVTVYVPQVAGSIAGGGTFCASTGDGTLILSGHIGVVEFWQFSENQGATWTDEQNKQPVHIHGDIVKDRIYRAIVRSVPNCDTDTSAIASFFIDKQSVPGTIVGSDTVCYGSPEGTLTVSGQTGSVTGWFVSNDLGKSWSSLNVTTNNIVYPVVKETKLYRVSVKNGICNADTSSPAIVAIFESAPADAGPDLTIVRHENVPISAKGNGTVDWDHGEALSDSTIINPTASPVNTTTFALTVTDYAGCVSVDTVVITVIVPVPTAITPNGDGVNDTFVIHKIEEYPRNSLEVYNRWGVLVYKASPYKNDWAGKSAQGTELPDEMYYLIYDNGTGEKPVASYILIKR